MHGAAANNTDVLSPAADSVWAGGALATDVGDGCDTMSAQGGQAGAGEGIAVSLGGHPQPSEALCFLLEAGHALAASLDYQVTLETIARLAVGYLADWCAVDMVETATSVRHVVVYHKDPAMVQLAVELRNRYPYDPSDQHGLAQVLRTGQPLLYEHISQELLELAARDAAHLRMLRQLGPRSAMMVPLVARGRTLGAISFVFSESGRRYTRADLGVACELAQRAALAVDNARLYEEAQCELAERRRAEQAVARQALEVAQQARRLARSNAELENFASVVSHDLRSPLLTISGSARLLAEEAGDSLSTEAMELIAFIQGGVEGMSELVKSLLSYARVGAGGLKVAPCDCQQVLEKVVQVLKAAIDAGRAVVTCEPLPVISADENLLAQLFQNLIENAVKYRGQDPPRIHVRAEEADGEWVFAVRDNGIGIDPKHFSTIFEVFHRLHDDESRYVGSGLGLATCKKIVDRHGGRIWVESQPGQGATFFFSIPR